MDLPRKKLGFASNCLCKEMTGCKNNRRADNGVYLEFDKAFETVSHLLIAK